MRINISAFVLLFLPVFAGASDLHELVNKNDVIAVRAYLESTPKATFFEINQRDDAGEVPLEIAIRLGNAEMQTLLIEFGAGMPEIEAGSPHRGNFGRLSGVFPKRRSPIPLPVAAPAIIIGVFGIESSPPIMIRIDPTKEDESDDCFDFDPE